MDKIPPPPQQVAVLGSEGKLSLPWNLWLTEFIKTLQNVGDGLDALGLYGSGSGGGVASSGSGPAVDLSLYPSSEGLSNLGARADHVHRRALGVEADAVEGGTTVQGFNIVGPILETFSEPDITADIEALLYAYWPLTEAAGTTRKATMGDAVTTDLVETGGTVPVATGLYGNAMSSTYAATVHLGADNNLSPSFGISSGFTFSIRFYMDSVSAGQGAQMLTLSDSGAYGFFVDRYENNIYAILRYGGYSSQIFTVHETLPLSQWHYLTCWYDTGTKLLYSSVDGGTPRTAGPLTGGAGGEHNRARFAVGGRQLAARLRELARPAGFGAHRRCDAKRTTAGACGGVSRKR